MKKFDYKNLKELIEFLQNTKMSRHFLKNEEFVESILNATKFLDALYGSLDIKNRIEVLREEILYTEQLICPCCKINYRSFSKKGKLNETCSKSCTDKINREKISKSHQSRSTEEIEKSNLKRKKKVLETWGAESVMQVDGIKQVRIQKSLEKYGTEVPSQSEQVRKKVSDSWKNISKDKKEEIVKSRIETNLEKWGVENPSQCDDIKQKKMLTTIKNHNVENPFQSKAIMENVRKENEKIFLEKYGVSNPMQSEMVKNKRKYKHKEKTGYEHPQQIPNNRDKNRIRAIEKMNNEQKNSHYILENKDEMTSLYQKHGAIELANILGVVPQTVYKWLEKHEIEVNGNTKVSTAEKEIIDFIQSFIDIDSIVLGSRKLLGNGKEVDIYLKNLNIGIEYNGLYWHSDLMVESSYHLDKTKAFKENTGGQLIHIFEDEWLHKKEIVKRKLKSLLGFSDEKKISARKCKIVELKTTDTRKFYDDNHIQGSVYRALYNIGLEYNGEIVACMSFDKTRTDGIELTRYATSAIIRGGFTKLLSYFKKTYGHLYVCITSFADKRYSVGKVYINNGFDHVYDTQPTYQYVQGTHRLHKSNFRKSRLKVLLGEKYDDTLTERDMTTMLNLNRIYDCGLMKFVLKLN